jgi:hypothetical protein
MAVRYDIFNAWNIKIVGSKPTVYLFNAVYVQHL